MLFVLYMKIILLSCAAARDFRHQIGVYNEQTPGLVCIMHRYPKSYSGTLSRIIPNANLRGHQVSIYGNGARKVDFLFILYSIRDMRESISWRWKQKPFSMNFQSGPDRINSSSFSRVTFWEDSQHTEVIDYWLCDARIHLSFARTFPRCIRGSFFIPSKLYSTAPGKMRF